MHKANGASWKSHWQWYRQFRRWSQDMQGREIPSESSGWCTAIILNFLRPQNLDLVVRSALLTPGIGKVIISNNNPECPLEQWLSIRSPRIQILSPPGRRSTFERFRIAAQETGEFFIAIDDDIFLYPEQLQVLCEAIRDEPAVPHGIFGEIHPEVGKSEYGIRGENVTVDVINRVYAFTYDHAQELFRLLQEQNLLTPSIWRDCLWDDITLSFCGEGRPKCHDVGPYFGCTSEDEEGIAAWRTERFFEDREEHYRSFAKSRQRKTTFRLPDLSRKPTVSVVMPVYNCFPDVEKAVESMLSQSFKDFEFIIVDDGSTDETAGALRAFAEKDSRIVLLRNQENCGVYVSSNRGIRKARGKYIARMDADDISHPSRLKKSVALLNERPEVELVATNWDWFSIPEDRSTGSSNLDAKPHLLAWYLFFFNYLSCQSAVMFRRRTAERVGLYNEEFRCVGDYDLWIRLMNEGDIAVVPEELVQFRRWRTGSVTQQMPQEQITNVLTIAQRAIQAYLHRTVSKEEVALAQGVLPMFWRTEDLPPAQAGVAKEVLRSLHGPFLRWWKSRRSCNEQEVLADLRRSVPVL